LPSESIDFRSLSNVFKGQKSDASIDPIHPFEMIGAGSNLCALCPEQDSVV
jgi:hypothetical protein